MSAPPPPSHFEIKTLRKKQKTKRLITFSHARSSASVAVYLLPLLLSLWIWSCALLLIPPSSSGREEERASPLAEVAAVAPAEETATEALSPSTAAAPTLPPPPPVPPPPPPLTLALRDVVRRTSRSASSAKKDAKPGWSNA